MSLDGILHVPSKKTITIDDRSTFAPQGLSLDFDIEGDGNLEVKTTKTYFRDVPPLIWECGSYRLVLWLQDVNGEL